MKILFLAANPINAAIRLRSDEEFREISQKIRMSPQRDQLELVAEWRVRVGDLQAVLMDHQPDIVHFSGHGSPTGGIILEDENGKRKEVSREAIFDLFEILKDNIRVVVLNACYAKDQAKALSEIIDFTIGMDNTIDEKASIIFASHFYQSLAFGRSVEEAFELAVSQLRLEGFDAAQAPNLLAREGAKLSQSLGKEGARKSRLRAFLPWLFASLAAILFTDVLRRFLGGDDGWRDIIAIVAQAVFVIAAALSVTPIAATLLRLNHPLAEKAASLNLFNKSDKGWWSIFLILIILALAMGLWLRLPAFARYHNEKGFGFQHGDPPDLSRARECYQLAARLKPSYAQPHYNLATVIEDLQPEKAMEEYLLAVRYDSHIYPAYNNLARLYLRRGRENDYESALRMLNQAVDLAPQEENVRYSLNKNLGWAHLALKRYPLAEMYLRRAISLRGPQGGAAAHCLLAYVLKEQGKPGVIDECFDCVSLAPGEKDIEDNWVSDARDCLMKGDGK